MKIINNNNNITNLVETICLNNRVGLKIRKPRIKPIPRKNNSEKSLWETYTPQPSKNQFTTDKMTVKTIKIIPVIITK